MLVGSRRWSLILFLGFHMAVSQASSPCPPALHALLTPYQKWMQQVADRKELRLMTWNVRNLYTSVGRYERQVTGLVKLSDKLAPIKSAESLRGLKHTIASADPDILILQEVESQISIQNFVSEYLDSKYMVFFASGNDPRGIGIAFLVKKDLPLTFELRLNAHERWIDPAKKAGQEPVPVFARDFPILIARSPDPSESYNPVLMVGGVHFKAMNSRPGDPQSEAWVRAEAERASEIIERLRKEFGSPLPLFVAGDFNRDPADHEAIQNLIRSAGLLDSLDLAGVAPHSDARTTFTVHNFQPGEAGAEQGVKKLQLDSILVEQQLKDAIQDAHVMPLRDHRNDVLPLPKTKAERDANPSDHRPVVLRIDPKRLLQSQGLLPAP